MKKVNKIVEMVVWFEKDGTPHPKRFRIKDEEEVERVIYIEKVIWRREEIVNRRRYLYFRCNSIFNGVKKIYDIKFDCKECKWYLYRM
ncbi:hypothetical protein [Clostridium sp. DL1XJH146]